MPSIIAAMIAVVTKGWVRGALYFIAAKMLLFTLFTVIMPIVLFKVWIKIQGWVFNMALSQLQGMTGELNPVVIELTGFAGWIADKMQLPQILMVLMGGALTAWTLRRFKLG